MESKNSSVAESAVTITRMDSETREQALISAVARYVNSAEFVNPDVILAILGIEKRNKGEK